MRLTRTPGTRRKFREITEAYEILSDKEKRVVYDHGGIGAVRKADRGEGQGGSPFDMFFGGGGGNEQKRGRNMEIEPPVTLEDLYVGNEKSATIKRRVVCRNCKNKAHHAALRLVRLVPEGEEAVHRRAGPGMIVQQEVMVESKEKCKREEKTLRATIEKGIARRAGDCLACRRCHRLRHRRHHHHHHLHHHHPLGVDDLLTDLHILGRTSPSSTSRSRSPGRSRATS